MPAKIIHYSDILCIWAHVGQQNLFRLHEAFSDRIEIETRFCSVFPDAHHKISTMWQDRGGFDGYAAHVQEVAASFEGFAVHKDAWRLVRPRSSASPHLFVKAIALLEGDVTKEFDQQLTTRAAKELRHAFFHEARDVANWNVQRDISGKIGVDFDEVLKKIETGEAIAALSADYEQARLQGVKGSPTYILNEGRQKLFGNISYNILEANIRELASLTDVEDTSTC